MFGDQKNLKDSTSNVLGTIVKDSDISIAYTKTNKLITALYMVTDIMDTDEPLRLKLRTLGVEIVSDIQAKPGGALGKIKELMSFLDIASAMNIISPMNASILFKEFKELNQAILDATTEVKVQDKEVDLDAFFRMDLSSFEHTLPASNFRSIGQPRSNSIGVQKGSTLLKALSKVSVSDRNMSNKKNKTKHAESFDVLKKQRREAIVGFIKKNKGVATITDIKTNATGVLENCGEKTLQRELISMLKDGVLEKTGEKRWSKYFIS